VAPQYIERRLSQRKRQLSIPHSVTFHQRVERSLQIPETGVGGSQNVERKRRADIQFPPKLEAQSPNIFGPAKTRHRI
jgi:hypothetical protein